MASAPGTDCSEIRLLLSSLVDGEATPEEAARAEAHVATCNDCASHLAFLRLTNLAIRRAPDAYPPSSLSARIAAATYERPTFAERLAGWLRPAPTRALLGAAVAAGAAAVFILPRIETVAPNPVANSTSGPAVARGTASASRVAAAHSSGAGASSGNSGKGTGSSITASPSSTEVASASASAASGAGATKPTPALTALPPRGNVSQPMSVATNTRPRNAAEMMANSAAVDAASLVMANRGEPQIDRNVSGARGIKRLVNPVGGMHKSRSAAVTPLRSGYDRSAATESVLHPTDIASANLSVPTVMATPAGGAIASQPRSVPTPTVVAAADSSAPKVASETDSASAATSAAAAAADAHPNAPATENGAWHFSTGAHRRYGGESISTDGYKTAGKGAGANDPYQFGTGTGGGGSVVASRGSL